jgi:hypothetical protein
VPEVVGRLASGEALTRLDSSYRLYQLLKVDRTPLTNILKICIPILHLGQAEAVKAVTAPCAQPHNGSPYGYGAPAMSLTDGSPNAAPGTPQPGCGHGMRHHPYQKPTSQ